MKLTTEGWSGFFYEKLHPVLSPVNMKAQHVYNQDGSGYFRGCLANIGKVWARKGRRWVARRGGYDRTHIIAMVCVSAAGKPVTSALLWIGKTVPGLLFSKEPCPVFIKATQGDGYNDSGKAASSSDTKAQDSKKKQKETKGGWSDASTFREWVREEFVIEVHPNSK